MAICQRFTSFLISNMKKLVFLLPLCILIILQDGFAQSTTHLFFRVNNTRIIRTFNNTYGDVCDNLEFNIDVKADIPTRYYAIQINLTNNALALTDMDWLDGYLINGSTWNGYYFRTYNMVGGDINLSIGSTQPPNSGTTNRFAQLTTNWQTLGTIRLRIIDPTSFETCSWITTSMDGQQYEKTFSPNNIQTYAGYSCVGVPFSKLYLNRIYAQSTGWSQTGGTIDDVQYINWPDIVNTSVLDSVGMITNSGCFVNKLRIHVGGRLKIMPAYSLTCMDSVEINEPNGLWLGSEFYGTGSFLDAGIITYHNNGSAGVERYLKQNQWHGYCIPVGTITTRPFLSLQLAMKWYDEPNHVYRSIVNPTMDSLLNREMLGYLVYSNSALTGHSTIKVTGSLNTGPIGFPMTNHIGPSGPDGWNLIGNPYPSAINWLSSSFSLDRVDPTIYVFHPEAGNYFFWNRHDQLHSNGASAVIAAQQGFYMHANAAGSLSGYVSLDNSIRLHSTQPFYKSDTLMNEHLILTVRGNNLTDETRIRFDSATSVLFDSDHDAYKLDGVDEAPQLYSVLPDSTRVALNARPWGGFYTLIPLGFHIGMVTTDTLVASNLESFLPGIVIWLEDKKTSIWVTLTQTPEYIFTSLPNDNPDRFLLHFSNPYTGLTANTGGFMKIYSFNSSVYVMNRRVEPASGDIYIYDITGRLIFKDKLKNIGLNKFEPGINQGYYIVKVVTDTNACIEKVFLK